MTDTAQARLSRDPSPSWLDNIRRRYFPTPIQSAISVIGLGLLGWLLWNLLDWAVFSAVWDPHASPETCRAAQGACWTVIAQRWRIILFGLYPFDQQWRSALACVVVVAMVVLSCVPAFWRPARLASVWVIGTGLFYVLMKGGVLGLPLIGEEKWGGLALTLFIFVATCLIGLPLSIIFAVGIVINAASTSAPPCNAPAAVKE